MGQVELCSISGCPKRVTSRGWCSKHYNRWRRYGDPTYTRRREDGVALRYIHDVVLAYDGDECLIWPFNRSSRGYAAIAPSIAYPDYFVQRIVCKEVYGEPPSEAHQAAHACGKGHLGCVAKAHLSWKTPVENVADKVSHGTMLRGERHGCAKLTEATIREIRTLSATIPQNAIARQFGISAAHTNDIIRKKAWSHVE